MKKVNNMEELEKLIGKEKVEKCFTEYMMLTIAKAKKLDELVSVIEEKNDTDKITIEELKNYIL